MRQLKKEIWPAKIPIYKDEFDAGHYEIECWLGENMGPFKGRWNQVPSMKGVDYYFRNTKDATMFALRWS
jgi:hypothetical protein